jgi:hypothetical protein
MAMAGKAQPKPIEVFEANISDAERLLAFAEALANGRKYGMRRELREAVGGALKIPKGQWGDLDCVESDDVFVLLKPGGRVVRTQFTEFELRPLLRQSVVAISTAVESYISEKAQPCRRACGRGGETLSARAITASLARRDCCQCRGCSARRRT